MAVNGKGFDAMWLMRFIDIFGGPPESIPRDVNGIMVFLRKAGFRENGTGAVKWPRVFTKPGGNCCFFLKIHRLSENGPRAKFSYVYEMTVRMTGSPSRFSECGDRLEDVLSSGTMFVLNGGGSDGNTGNGIKQDAQDQTA